MHRENTTLIEGHFGGVKREDARLSEAWKRIGGVKNVFWGVGVFTFTPGDRGRSGAARARFRRIFGTFAQQKMDFCVTSRAWEAQGVKFPVSGETYSHAQPRFR